MGTRTSSIFPAEKESATEESGKVTASELLDAVIKNVIMDYCSHHAGEKAITWDQAVEME